MSKRRTVSFTVRPDQYLVLRAMAAGANKSLSAYLRETVDAALDLDRQAERLAALFTGPGTGGRSPGRRTGRRRSEPEVVRVFFFLSRK